MQHRLRVVLTALGVQAPPLSPRLSDTGKERKDVSGGEVEVQSVQPLRRTLRIRDPFGSSGLRRGVGGSTPQIGLSSSCNLSIQCKHWTV